MKINLILTLIKMNIAVLYNLWNGITAMQITVLNSITFMSIYRSVIF